MSIKIIEDRLATYKLFSKNDELNAIKEIMQEIVLFSLSRANLFKEAAFQGGTCLRIIYGMSRFSEDLDFVLFKPNTNFKWKPFLKELELDFSIFGLSLTTIGRSEIDNNVKRVFLKEDSFGTILNLSYERNRADVQSIRIKLEIDANPPAGSEFMSQFIDFPVPFSVVTQDLGSLFAGKLHALLCRNFTKGRDWYDLIWYITRQLPINFDFLKASLYQLGPYSNLDLNIDLTWLKEHLIKRINEIDWQVARADVEAFVPQHELASIRLWNSEFFKYYINKI